MHNFEHLTNPADFIKTIYSTYFIFIKNSYWKAWGFFAFAVLPLTRIVLLMGLFIFLRGAVSALLR